MVKKQRNRIDFYKSQYVTSCEQVYSIENWWLPLAILFLQRLSWERSIVRSNPVSLPFLAPMEPIGLGRDATARSFARCRWCAIDLARQVRPSQRRMTQRHRPRFVVATSVDDNDDEVRVRTRDIDARACKQLTPTVSRARTSNTLNSNYTDVALIDRSKWSKDSRRDGRQKTGGCRKVNRTAGLGLTSSCVSSAAGIAYWRRVAAFAWSLNAITMKILMGLFAPRSW